MNFNTYLNIFLVAFFSSVIAVPLLRRWAVQTGKLDQPDRRKVHTKAIPRLGGVAIIFSFLLTALIFFDYSKELRGLLVGLILIFIIGLLDDLLHLTARQKFLGQISAALFTTIISGVSLRYLGDLFGFGPITLPFWVAIPFTVFAIVGVINAINMIDGLDGLSGGVSIIALGAFFYLFFASGNLFGMSVTVALVGSLLGFLKHNSYPARIFMGDAGSLSLGFLLAFLAIQMTQTEGSTVSPVVPVLILGLPIVDTLMVMGRRITKRQSPFTPDMTHVHHTFLNLGLSHRFTVLLIYLYSFFWALFALLLRDAPEYLLLGCYLLSLIVLYRSILFMRQHPERFLFLQKDASSSLRETRFYFHVLRFTRWTTPVLLIVVLVYLLISVIACAQTGAQVAQLALTVFIGGVILALLPRERRIRFETLYYVAASLFLVLTSEWQCHLPIESMFDFHPVSHLLFVAIAVLVGIKIAFRKEGEVYLTSPLDYLFLVMVLSLVAVPDDLAISHKIPSAVMKSIFFILALKILIIQNRYSRRTLFWSLQLALLVIFFRNGF